MTDKPLTNKTVWITGSSRGIGRATAMYVASLGARVAVHGTTPTSTRAFGEANSLEAVADEIHEKTGEDVFPVWGDLTDEAAVKRVATQVRERFGRIDCLVNNAGGDIGVQGVLGERGGIPANNDPIHISLADLRTVLDRNLMTCILCCREVGPEMIARRSGTIVNLGSLAGLDGHPISGAIYSTAKAAVHQYTRCLADMMRPYDVHVNAVAPGMIATPRFLSSRKVDPAMRQPGGTLVRYGSVDEIAHVVGFLLTDAASFIDGQVIRVDGGLQLYPA